MIFKPMKASDVRKAIEGQENVIVPAVKERDDFFRKLACPNCGGECMPFLDPDKMWKEGAILPRTLARCKACGCDFEPYSGIQITVPRPSKVSY